MRSAITTRRCAARLPSRAAALSRNPAGLADLNRQPLDPQSLDAVLTAAGYTPDDVEELKTAGVVATT